MNDKWRKYFLLGVFTFFWNCFYILSMLSPFSPLVVEVQKNDARKLSTRTPSKKKHQQKLFIERYLKVFFSFFLFVHSRVNIRRVCS